MKIRTDRRLSDHITPPVFGRAPNILSKRSLLSTWSRPTASRLMIRDAIIMDSFLGTTTKSADAATLNAVQAVVSSDTPVDTAADRQGSQPSTVLTATTAAPIGKAKSSLMRASTNAQ